MPVLPAEKSHVGVLQTTKELNDYVRSLYSLGNRRVAGMLMSAKTALI